MSDGVAQPCCPHPIELQEKLRRLGWGGWILTPGATDEDKELYASLGDWKHIHIMSVAEALALSDEELQRHIEICIGMTYEEACERHGVDSQNVNTFYVQRDSGAKQPRIKIISNGGLYGGRGSRIIDTKTGADLADTVTSLVIRWDQSTDMRPVAEITFLDVEVELEADVEVETKVAYRKLRGNDT